MSSTLTHTPVYNQTARQSSWSQWCLLPSLSLLLSQASGFHSSHSSKGLSSWSPGTGHPWVLQVTWLDPWAACLLVSLTLLSTSSPSTPPHTPWSTLLILNAISSLLLEQLFSSSLNPCVPQVSILSLHSFPEKLIHSLLHTNVSQICVSNHDSLFRPNI